MAEDGSKRTLSPGFLAQQFKKGQSGNPNGRPRRVSFETLVERILDEQLAGDGGITASKRELIARIFVDEMVKRNGRMIREFLQRAWPAPQKHEVSGVNGGPITLADFVQLARADYEPCPCSTVPTECSKADLDLDDPCNGCGGLDESPSDVAAPEGATETQISSEEVGVVGRIRLGRKHDA